MMPLLDKLFPLRKSFKSSAESSVPSNIGVVEEDDWKSTLCPHTEQVRILLFRECEWRGRKLLFDSLTLEKYYGKSQSSPGEAVKHNVTRKCEASNNVGTSHESERGKAAANDVTLLSEMVFGTVAMTYRGSSFKVHSMTSPPCIMCTKVFPSTEHGMCKQSEKVSDESLGRSTNLDSNSSNASVRTAFSRPSSGNLSGNDLTAGPRKSSTCSSVGSGWDIEIPPRLGSSQSLESSGSSGMGSLTSLRRRWLRAVSTSLSRSDSDDAFGIQHWTENGCDSREGHGKRHKTRLGLAMIVRLSKRKMEERLLEHMALLEGMLDRLRYFCIEVSAANGHGCCKEIQLAERMYKASSRLVMSLIRLLVNVSNLRTPLLWHDVLLNSTISVEEKTNTLHRRLQQMCQLLDDVDTKSTNFFLSTVVTAVLTYHLGWVNTILPSHDRHVMDKLTQCYPCNPLWAQLNDLYGAVGSPVKVAHTVIAGDPQKTELINSVLSFLSYFIRSGIVQRRQEFRCPSQEDVEDATNVVEQFYAKRPYLFNRPKQNNTIGNRDGLIARRESRTLSIQKQAAGQLRITGGGSGETNAQRSCPDYLVDQTAATDASLRQMKRSNTMKSNLDGYMLKPIASEGDMKLELKELSHKYNDYEKAVFFEDEGKDCATSKVKIVVSDTTSQETDVTKSFSQQQSQFASQNFEKKLLEDDAIGTADLDKVNNINSLKFYSDRSDFQDILDKKIDDNKEAQVFFTLGDEERSSKLMSRPRLGCNCQCSNTFTRVPSTSAQLPEGVLRKIIQRNFPESSKSIQAPPGAASSMASRSLGFCLKCNNQGSSQSLEGTKELLETPTNATEVLRTCGSSGSDGAVGLTRSNSLEALMEANNIIELPMPRSKKVSPEKTCLIEETGFTHTLVQSKVTNDVETSLDTGYTWGLVLQGLTKKRKKRKRAKPVLNGESQPDTSAERKDWWHFMQEEVFASARFPTIDQPVAEALCILADLDTWRVGILSNNTSSQHQPLPVGMSRLVSDMLEAFAYVWRKYHSPSHCVEILESKLREMWLRSEALAELLMTAELCDASVTNLTNALDVDAADIPLLLAVATTHSPEIAQRFGLTLA